MDYDNVNVSVTDNSDISDNTVSVSSELWQAESENEGENEEEFGDPSKTPPRLASTKRKRTAVRYNCTFNTQWTKQFSWLAEANSQLKARCIRCKTEFSIANRGINQVR